MKSTYFLTPMLFGVAAIVATPFQSAQALNATEVGAIAEAVTVRIDGQNPGSGVIIKRQGDVYIILTAAHVVATEDEYHVVTPDSQLHDLDYSKVKKFPQVDLALVEFTSSKTYKVADIGDSTEVKAGALIYVSGFPLPTAAITESIWNFSEGKVTANSKRPLADGYALIYSNDTLPGMSGGAVLNNQGKLIAIHGRADAEQAVQKTETIYHKTGFNLGIPINTFLSLVANVSPGLGFIGRGTEVARTALIADDWLLQATDKYGKGNFQDALKDFDQAIALDPQNANAYGSRGRTYHELKQYLQAIKDFDQAIALDPQNTHSYINRGNSHFKLKQYPQALEDYDQAIALDPKYIHSYNNRGYTYHELKQYSQALKDFDQAIALDPKNVNAYGFRGRTYHELRRYSKAIKSYDQAIALDPKNATTYNNRGYTYRKLKQYPQALKDFDQAITLDPKNLSAYNNRGLTYYDLKQYSQAIKDFDQAIALDPKYVHGYTNRGYTYRKLKQYPQALKDFDQAIALDPKYVYGYINRGDTYFELKHYPQAINDYSQAIALDPMDAIAYKDRGKTYINIGNKTLAKQDLKKAAQLLKQQNNQRELEQVIKLLEHL